MSGFQRPEGGWRFDFNGVKINDTADALQPKEYPYAQNIRRYKDSSIQTRPGYVRDFTTAGAAAITDIRAYATLGTDNLPRILVRDVNNRIYLDDGTLLTTLTGTSKGAVMIPYRPSQSPQSWMYVGVQNDYRKISAPDANGVVTTHLAGIEEQHTAPDACPEALNFYSFTSNAAGWAQGGTAGALSDQTRVNDTLGTVLEDPASGTEKRCSCAVTTTKQYQLGMTVIVDTTIEAVVQDILPPVNAGTTITIESIYYYSGTSGRCVIVPTQQPSSPSVPTVTGNSPSAASIYSDSVLSSLRRGSIVNLDNGVAPDEDLFVLSVTVGPNGTICFEVETTATYTAGDDITGVPAIVINGVTASNTGDTITSAAIQSTLTGSGTGTVSQTFANNPFEQQLDPSTSTPQQDDYIGISVNINNLSRLIRGTITFNTEPGAPTYDTNGFYAQFDASNLVFHQPAASQVTETVVTREEVDFDGNIITIEDVVTSTTPLPSSQWTTVMFPIRALKRLGNDLTKTLADCNGIRISIDASDTIVLQFGSLWVGGGGQPDVGNNGSPYFYIVVGRNQATGAMSNPSPMTRYGVSPRRQQVRVIAQDDVSDPQMDVWDVYRYGGSVSSWRRIGSMPNTGGVDEFIDMYFDNAAQAGAPAEYDNYQPWPSIDIPYSALAGVVSGVATLISVVGTTAIVTYYSAAPFTNPAPDTILRWLPGTLVTIGGQNAYTLRNRPVAATLASPPTANYYAYLFEFVENIGTLTPDTFTINEPNVANQHLPYLWGPDANGTIFAAGDPLRPGSFYACKNFAPDSAPDTNNQELTNPSEPVLGGEVINGLSMAASTKRWWALYPNFNNTRNRYQAVEKPVGRGLAAPYGHCTDGKYIYFWAKDGIWITGGAEGKSLTDDMLYNLFPHEGANTPANYTYAGYTLYAPDYRYAASFRLAFGNGFLYADYLDSTATPRTLVCDLTGVDAFMGGEGDPPAWQPDVYADQVRVHYAIEQQESTLVDTSARYNLLLMGDAAGKVYHQAFNTNDAGTAINGVIATFEYNGGDIRAEQLFNDAFVDSTPIAGLNVQPISGGAAIGTLKTIPASATRVQTNAPVGEEAKYLGVLLTWTDNFNIQSTPTLIHAWQPMYQAVPVSVFDWKTQITSFGWAAYGHLRQWNISYRALADVTITITAYDGNSPAVITLPATAGEVVKIMVPFTFNKGMLYRFFGTSTAEWAPYLSESELFVGAWGREDAYQLVHDISAPVGIRS